MPVAKMTKKEATSEFKEWVRPLVIKAFGKDDKVAMSEAWGIFTDSLCKEGRITLKQYESWTNLF